jgi:putative Mg2+ transporter-C (MgtC) family protein
MRAFPSWFLCIASETRAHDEGAFSRSVRRIEEMGPRDHRESALIDHTAGPGADMDTFDVVPHLRDLAIAYTLAMPIAWDREREERTAGLRTFPLVAIASCGFIQASEHLLPSSPNIVTGALQGLIAGMGFIGGGTILREGSFVHGTATAASLWATAAIGVAVALGSYDVAVVISIATFLTLRLPKRKRPDSELVRRTGEDRS